MNSKRHSRLRRHQLAARHRIAGKELREIRRVQQRLAEMVAREVVRIMFEQLEGMLSGEASGGVVRPGAFFVGEKSPELFLPRAIG